MLYNFKGVVRVNYEVVSNETQEFLGKEIPIIEGGKNE